MPRTPLSLKRAALDEYVALTLQIQKLEVLRDELAKKILGPSPVSAPSNGARGTTVGCRIIDLFRRSPDGTQFKPIEIHKALGKAKKAAVSSALYELVHKGTIKHAGPGIYTMPLDT
jgi:hypothetical protein